MFQKNLKNFQSYTNFSQVKILVQIGFLKNQYEQKWRCNHFYLIFEMSMPEFLRMFEQHINWKDGAKKKDWFLNFKHSSNCNILK